MLSLLCYAIIDVMGAPMTVPDGWRQSTSVVPVLVCRVRRFVVAAHVMFADVMSAFAKAVTNGGCPTLL